MSRSAAARRTRLGALAAFAVLAVPGCSLAGAAGPGPTAPAPSPDPDVRPLGGLTAYSHADAVRLFAREEDAVAACMAERGKPYRRQTRTSSARAEETSPYGLVGPRRAAADGYGIVGEVLHRAAHPRPAEQQPGDPAWQEALTGTPAHLTARTVARGGRLTYSTDGCVARADVLVYGEGWPELEAGANAVANHVLGAVERDPAHRAAITRWAACMAEAGYPGYGKDGLQAPRKVLNARLAAAGNDPAKLRALGAEEIRTAEADARCEAGADLAGVVATVQNAVEARLLTAADRAVLDRFRTLKERALATP
ncbi:hypothetical protein ACIQUQ_30840 [Streptomyces sp. NPDC101118]|uniref:hypothetical protein n=1 Tax=Streptomyces sp. NPDC101118 TaxID=3366109 RepID=UPI00381EEF49